MVFIDYPGHIIAIGMVIFCVAGIFFTFKSNHLKRLGFKRWALAILPLAAMIILLFIFFNPSSMQMAEDTIPCTVQVFFDTSKSMSIKDMYHNTRLQYALDLFEKKISAKDLVSPNYQIFGFDEKCYPANSLGSLIATGEKTNLGALWQTICKQSMKTGSKAGTAPVTGAIVFTDGQADDQNIQSYAAIQNEDFSVLIIPIGSLQDKPDIAVKSLDVPLRAAVNTTYKATAEIEAIQLKDEPIQIDLLRNGHIIASKVFVPKLEKEAKTLEFEVSTSSTGLDRVELVAKTTIDELSKDNNSQIEIVDVVSNDQRRVLVYSQVADFDIGKIRQALKRDEKIDLDFRYDVVYNPAVTKMNPNLNQQVKLPLEDGKLNDYDVLILGSMDFNTLKESQVQSIYEFVSVRGGAVIFLPGKDQYALDKIKWPQIHSLLPVTFNNHVDEGDYIVHSDPVSLTMEAKATAMFADAKVNETVRYQTKGYSNIEKKPAASTFFTFSQTPFVCIQRLGRGYVTLLNSFTLFQLYREDQEGGLLQELLSDTIAYVSRVGAKESRIDLVANIDSVEGQVIFEAHIRDSEYKLVDGATVLLDVNGQLMRMKPSSKGRYTSTLENVDSQSVYAVVKAELGGNFLGEKTIVLNVPQKRTEMSRTEVNYDFIEKLSKNTNTQFLKPFQVDANTNKLFKATQTVQKKAQPMPIWHHWTVLFVLCTVLTANWFIRRTMGFV